VLFDPESDRGIFGDERKLLGRILETVDASYDILMGAAVG
jgi:hypothetical protein